MIEHGIVIKKDRTGLEVRMQPSSSCGHCNLCNLQNANFPVMRLEQPVECTPGDRVDIEVSPGFAIKSAVLLFFLPLVMLLVGYYLFPALVDIPGMNAVYQGIIGGLLGFGLSFLGIHFYDKHLQKQGLKKKARVVRVVR